MSTHATAPTATGRFLAYPLDATGAAADYWRDAGGVRVRMTGACKRAFLATIEALLERAVVPANVDDSVVSVASLASATFGTGAAPFSLVSLGAWATAANRDAVGALLARGMPRGKWELLIEKVWTLWRATTATISYAMHQDSVTILFWQRYVLEATSSGFTMAEDTVWGGIYSRDWSGAYSDADEAGGGDGVVVKPWGSYVGGTGSSAVESALQGMFDDLSSGISVGGGSGILGFAEDALAVSPPVMLMDGSSIGNWFTTSAAAPVGSMSQRRSAAAWGVLQAMLAQMKHTHAVFRHWARYTHVIEERTVSRYLYFDSTDMLFHCYQVGDTTGASTTTLDYIENIRGYDWPSNISPEVDFAFYVDNSDPDALSVLALEDISNLDTLPDGRPYAVIGTTFLTHCTFVSQSPVTWGKISRRQYGSAVASSGISSPPYPADELVDYVDAFGPVHFADSLDYDNGSTHVQWTKYSLHYEDGDADLTQPVADHAAWLLSQVPVPTLPSIAPFNQTAFDAAAAHVWDNVLAAYPTTPNCTIGGVPMYYPTMISTKRDGTNNISLNQSGTAWEGIIKLGFTATVDPVFPPDSDEIWQYSTFTSPRALAGYTWQFKAMPTTT